MILKHDEPPPPDLPIPTNRKGLPEGVLIDTGTGKRVPFVRWYDPDTGEYEAVRATADGQNYSIELDGRPRYVRGRAVGKLKVISVRQAVNLGHKPMKVASEVVPVTKDEKIAGLEMYKRAAYIPVHQYRGDSRRVVEEKFAEYLKSYDDEELGADLFDFMILKRRPISTRAT